VLTNGTVLLKINGQKYAVNGADAATFSLDEFNTLRVKMVAGNGAGREVTYETSRLCLRQSGYPDWRLHSYKCCPQRCTCVLR